jgi:hypothetical protein
MSTLHTLTTPLNIKRRKHVSSLRTVAIDGDCIRIVLRIPYLTLLPYASIIRYSTLSLRHFSLTLTRPTFDDRQLIDMIPVRVIKLSEQPIPTLTPFRQWVPLLHLLDRQWSMAPFILFLFSPPGPPRASPLTFYSIALSQQIQCAVPFEAMSWPVPKSPFSPERCTNLGRSVPDWLAVVRRRSPPCSPLSLSGLKPRLFIAFCAKCKVQSAK